MISNSKKRAEEIFASTKKKNDTAQDEQQEKAQKVRENTARLKALRLAKQAADEVAPTAKSVSGSKSRK